VRQGGNSSCAPAPYAAHTSHPTHHVRISSLFTEAFCCGQRRLTLHRSFIVVLENLTVAHLIKKNSPAFYETRRFITVFTKAGNVKAAHISSPHFVRANFITILPRAPLFRDWYLILPFSDHSFVYIVTSPILQNLRQTCLMLCPFFQRAKGKGKVAPCAQLIKHYAMKAYGGVDV
jgi:hypothetical protein